MANHKTGIMIKCEICDKNFYIIKSRIELYKKHYCSHSCSSTARWNHEVRSYPKEIGKCIFCEEVIIAKSASYNKPTRKFCSYSCRTAYSNKTTPKTVNQIKSSRRVATLYMAHRIRTNKERASRSESMKGAKSHFWKGGLTNANRLLRNNAQTKRWKRDVLVRDDFTCKLCGQRGGTLEVDHIKRWADFPELRWDLDNGRTLCKPCHRMTPTFGGKVTNHN